MNMRNLRSNCLAWMSIPAIIAAATMPLLAGSDAAAFLNAGVGGRAMAMGGAYVSVGSDATSMYWNPAGLGKLNRTGLSAMGQSVGSGAWDTLKDVNPSYQYVGITFPYNRFSLPGVNNATNTFGIGMMSCSLGDIPYTTLDNNGVIVRDTMDDAENAYFISYGFPLLDQDDNLYAGVTFKYLTQRFSKISGASAAGMDLDFGLLYSVSSLNLGLVLQRGADLRWSNGRTDSAPLTTKLGISNTFALSDTLSLLGSADMVQRQNQPITLNIGAELGYRPSEGTSSFRVDGLFARLGVDSLAVENRYDYLGYINNNFNYTAGVGIDLRCLGYSVQFDYAFGSYRLGSRNRFSVSMYL